MVNASRAWSMRRRGWIGPVAGIRWATSPTDRTHPVFGSPDERATRVRGRALGLLVKTSVELHDLLHRPRLVTRIVESDEEQHEHSPSGSSSHARAASTTRTCSVSAPSASSQPLTCSAAGELGGPHVAEREGQETEQTGWRQTPRDRLLRWGRRVGRDPPTTRLSTDSGRPRAVDVPIHLTSSQPRSNPAKPPRARIGTNVRTPP